MILKKILIKQTLILALIVSIGTTFSHDVSANTSQEKIQKATKAEKLSNATCAEIIHAARYEDIDSAKKLVLNLPNIKILDEEGASLLHNSIFTDNTDFVEWLVSLKLDPNLKNIDGNCPLHYCACYGTAEIAKVLLKNGAKVNEKNNKGKTPLHVAVANEKNLIVELLLENKADASVKTDKNLTPLVYAIRSKNNSCARILLDKTLGLDTKPNDDEASQVILMTVAARNIDFLSYLNDKKFPLEITIDGNRWSALHLAAHLGYADIAEQLIKLNEEIDTCDNEGKTPLAVALREGHYKVAQKLIRAGANPNAKSKNGVSCLGQALAARNIRCLELMLKSTNSYENNPDFDRSLVNVTVLTNQPKAIDLLAEHGYSINTATQDGITPLHNAAKYKFTECIKVLLKHNANINTKNKQNDTPLHYAVLDTASFDLKEKERKLIPIDQSSSVSDTINLLLNNGALINAANMYGLTPLHYAVEVNSFEAINTLLDNRANIEAIDKLNHTPLQKAITSGNTGVAELLFSRNADISTRNNMGFTLIHLATVSGIDLAVEWCLSKGLQANISACKGIKPIHLAASWGSIDVIKILLKNGAEIDSKDLSDATPLHYAAKMGQSAIVKFLVDNGANVNTQTVSGKTPLDFADKYENITKMLQTCGAQKGDVKGGPSLLIAHLIGKAIGYLFVFWLLYKFLKFFVKCFAWIIRCIVKAISSE